MTTNNISGKTYMPETTYWYKYTNKTHEQDGDM